ncbi:MAG: hypothetical protein IJV52_11270 [Prevotella sp.]|nr:hypothetical protein [Prevotella sp.]
MMKNKYMLLLAVLALCFTACNYDEDELEPSNVLTSYQLPQGNHDYDQTIVDFYKKNGVYLLYNFSDKDAYWHVSGWKMFEEKDEYTAAVPGGNYICEPADQNYVKQQIALLDEVWFSKMTDKAKKELLPTKILLCNEVDSCYVTAEYIYTWTPVFSYTVEYTTHKDDVKAWYNYDHICVGWGNSNVTSMTAADKQAFASKLFHIWPEFVAERKAGPSEEFASSVDYSSIGYVSYIADCCAKGILSESYNATPANDWRKFIIGMLCFSEEWLYDESITAPGQYDGWSNTSYGAYYVHEQADYHGLLSSKKDTNGILKRRYQIVRQYFIDNYGMDLQSIGNAQ